MKKLTNEQVIQKSIEIHGDKYLYDKVKYINYHSVIEIYCKKCKIYFKQTVASHISKKCGCPHCANNIKLSKEQFIEKSIKIHGNKYDYTKSKYISNGKVEIYCKKCDKYFLQYSNNHLKGHGCPYCSHNKKSDNKNFKETANIIHNNFYDYSLVNYKNNSTKVDIICPVHGVFKQSPEKHILRKHGCPKCNASKAEKQIDILLKNNDIIFITQKKFNDCRNILPLPFDFYIPDLNICIEFDGQQHFRSFQKFGGIKKLEDTIRNDNIKTEYCLRNNIKLLRIKYNQNIEKILNEQIFKK